jgi:hypothetical protein
MEFSQLRAILALRELASLAKAGERLHLSPSALFCQIRQLEDELGQKLYERIGNRQRLTETGELLAQHGTRSGLAAYPYFDSGNARAAAGKKQLPASAGSFLDLETANAQVSALKQAEDGAAYMLRLRETVGRDATARLRSPRFRITSAFLTDGVEDNQRPLALKTDTLDIPLQPNRFSTVRRTGAATGQTARR